MTETKPLWDLELEDKDVFYRYEDDDASQLSKLFDLLEEHNAKYTWLSPKEKNPNRKDWHNDPITWDWAREKLSEGKSIGILITKSPDVAVLDIDANAIQLMEDVDWLNDSPQIYRVDNLDKAKFIFANKTTAPGGRAKIGDDIDVFIGGGDKAAQAIIAGVHEKGELYKAKNVNGYLPELTDEMLDELSLHLIGEEFCKRSKKTSVEVARKPGLPIIFPDDTLPEGVGNETLFRYACSLWSRGHTQRQIHDICHSLLERVEGTVTSVELDAAIESATKYAERDGDKKKILSHEYILVLNLLGYEFSMSDLDDRVFVNDKPISDPIKATINCDLRDFGYTYVNVAKDAYTANAFENLFHPVKDYFNSLLWDGEDHIAKLASYFKDRDDVFKLWLRRWLIGSVERVFKDGKQNRVLVIDGRQDLGKSYFARWLCPLQDVFYEGGLNPDSKDDEIRLINTWIWEISELGATTRRSDREALKHRISQEKVRVRLPYGHHDVDKPALASFLATVNNSDGFLNDPTGNRRYISCTVTEIDWDYATEVDVNQVWAQALALHQDGETGRLSKKERDLANEINARYEVVNPVAVYLESAVDLDPETFTPTEDFLVYLREKVKMGDTALAREISAFMKNLEDDGVAYKQKMHDGRRTRGYQGVRLLEATSRRYV